MSMGYGGADYTHIIEGKLDGPDDLRDPVLTSEPIPLRPGWKKSVYISFCWDDSEKALRGDGDQEKIVRT